MAKPRTLAKGAGLFTWGLTRVELCAIMQSMETLYEWASQFGSHGIYPAERLEELAQWDIRPSIIPTYTVEQQRGLIEARGLGGYVQGEPQQETFTGHELSEALAKHVTGSSPGDAFMGRGRRHTANLAALRTHATASAVQHCPHGVPYTQKCESPDCEGRR
jgi:hypothetical protein